MCDPCLSCIISDTFWLLLASLWLLFGFLDFFFYTRLESCNDIYFDHDVGNGIFAARMNFDYFRFVLCVSFCPSLVNDRPIDETRSTGVRKTSFYLYLQHFCLHPKNRRLCSS